MQIKAYSSAVQFGFKKSDRPKQGRLNADIAPNQAATPQKKPILRKLAMFTLLGTAMMSGQAVLASHKPGHAPSQSDYYVKTHPYFQKYFTKGNGGHGQYCDNGFAGDNNWKQRQQDWQTGKPEKCYRPRPLASD